MELISGRMLDESIWHTLNGMTLFGSTAQGKRCRYDGSAWILHGCK